MRRLSAVLGVLVCTALNAQPSGRADLPCSGPLAILEAFYDCSDALRFDQCLGYFTEDATIATWATGVNGHIMAQREASGAREIRAFLPQGRGLRRGLPDAPAGGPIYHETRIKVSGNTVRLMLEPDRRRPDGRLYPPFSVEAVLNGCRIKTLTVVEQVTWL